METENSYQNFGKQLFSLLDKRGWNVLPKRELVLCLLDTGFKLGHLTSL
jgi:hypothetical protein